jgi:hypothetical protein
LKGEREAVVAEVSLTRQQVQTEESTKKRKPINYSTEKHAEEINQCFNSLSMILLSWERSEILV